MYRYKLDTWRYPVLSRQSLPSTFNGGRYVIKMKDASNTFYACFHLFFIGNNNQTHPILIDWLMFGNLTFRDKYFMHYTNIFYRVSQQCIDINWTRDGIQFSVDNPYLVLLTVADRVMICSKMSRADRNPWLVKMYQWGS
jgi:hypothetical protein